MTTSEAPSSRRQERYRYITFTWYHSAMSDRDNPEEGIARSCDISEQGLGMITARPLPQGGGLLVAMVSRFGNLTVYGRVMFCMPLGEESFRIGVHVDCVPPTYQPTWQKVINARKDSLPPSSGRG